MAETAFDTSKDPDPLPGPAKSWAKGEAVPKDMPSADVSGASPPAGDDSLAALTGGLADIQRRKMASDASSSAALVKNIDQHVATVEDAYKHAGIQDKEFKPWNAEEESKKHAADPIESFGSLGSVFGILASAFTHQPFYTALNASAAAINAIKEGKQEEYERAYKAWQDNTKLALDRHKIQEEHYRDATELLKTNMAAGEAKMKVLAARFGDEKMLFLLDHGMNKEVLDLEASRTELASKLHETFFKTTLENVKMSELFKFGYDPKHPDSEASTKAVQQFDRVYGASKSVDESFTRQYWEEHPNATSDDYSKAFGEFKQRQHMLTSTLGKEDAAELVRRTAQFEAQGLSHEEAFDKARVEIEKKRSPDNSATLSADALHRMAEQYLAGDKSVFQNLGRGRQGSANIVALRDTVAELMKERNISGTEQATHMAEFSGLMAGQRALGTRTANVEMFANEALNMIEVAEDISHTIPRTDFVPINKALQSYERNTGDPKIVKFGAAINAVINTYAKAIAGGQQATVSDKEHAREIVTAPQSQAQFDAVMEVVKRELQAARKAPGQVKQEFRDLSGASSAIERGKVPPPQNVIRYDREGNRVAD